MNEELSEDDWRDDVIADEINEDDWMVDMTLKQTLQLAPPEKFDYDRIDVPHQCNEMNLPMVVGKKEDGSVLVVDLARMPHLLMAGATGQGKTTFIETMLYGFISRFTSEEIRFVLYDEKCVEFVQWEQSPYLTMPVVNEPKEAVRVLKVLSGDMDRRFKILAAAGCRNIQEFNNRNVGATTRLPYLVFVADEIVDLMAAEGKRAVTYLSRLTAMGRAAGIHIVLSTQRPDRKVLTGLLKANIPGRIAFKVCSANDSLQVIDARGAENLNGRGDLLFKNGTDEIVHAQGGYVPYETLCKRIEATKSPSAEPLPAINDPSRLDEDYPKAIECIRHKKIASISQLQRGLGFGYNHASAILDKMEANGLIGPSRWPKRREIYWDKFPKG